MDTHMESQSAPPGGIMHAIMVLLVDDQPFVAELLQRKLADEKDISIHYCQESEQAVSTAEKIGPTVILLDLVMPGIDGLSVCRFIRAHPSICDIPVIMLSSNDDPVTKAAAFAAGANDYIVKLPDSIELVARLRYHSAAYVNKQQRDDAYRALRASNAELWELNAKLEQAQSQLMQSEKMASIGLLAAGVAHEINNPIGYIQSNLATLETYIKKFLAVLGAYEKLELSIPDKNELFAEVDGLKKEMDIAYLKQDVEALLSESNEGIDRVKMIVQNLKDFSRVDVEDKWNRENIHFGLDSTLNVIWNELKYKCEVVKEYGVLPPVECLLFQLNQVFMNLLVNAAQAIETHGRITIRTGTRNDQIWIEIIDDGKGISPENLNRIFDPFFTTKPIGKGTGLGLFVSFSIIQRHHGRIEVESIEGKGSTFRVWLPIKQPVGDDVAPAGEE